MRLTRWNAREHLLFFLAVLVSASIVAIPFGDPEVTERIVSIVLFSLIVLFAFTTILLGNLHLAHIVGGKPLERDRMKRAAKASGYLLKITIVYLAFYLVLRIIF